MPKKITFEAALQELERTVDALEAGDLSLEESMAKFEEGVKLASQCAELLSAAETNVQKLIKRADDAFDVAALDGSEEDTPGGQES